MSSLNPLSHFDFPELFCFTYRAHTGFGWRIVFVWVGRDREAADEAFAETVGSWPGPEVEVIAQKVGREACHAE